MTDMVKKFQSQVRNNIDYFELSEGYETNIEQLDEIVDLMFETLCSARPTISVAAIIFRRRWSRNGCLRSTVSTSSTS